MGQLQSVSHSASRVASASTQARESGCIHQFIEQQAARRPENIAVTFEDRNLSYRELNQKANQLAHFLRKRGVGPESVVGLGIPRSDDLLVGLLAIWKAGAAYVPLDADAPKERLKYTLKDSQAKLVLSHQALENLWDETAPERILVDQDWSSISRESKENPPCLAQSHHWAQLLYTSGSTGQPKGVQILHRGLVNFMEYFKVEPGIREDDTVAATTTPSFDTSGVELFIPLTAGARIVMFSADTLKSLKKYFALIESGGVTILQGTPTSMRWFVEFGWNGGKNLKIISGGEELKRDLADELLPRCKELWNIYGPTEGTIWVTLCRVPPGPGPVPIGHPISRTQIYLLGPDRKPVPDGEEGEIYVGGAGVARGYYNRPEITAERFLPDPFSNEPNAKMYRTGDLARMMPSGELEFRGRVDHQIKINGMRIEPGEIEATISQFDGVRHSVVIAREDTPGEKRLVGYVVMRDGAQLETQQLRQFLLDRLPRTMVPLAFVTLPALPTLPNGKLNRNALPPPGLPSGKTQA